ncbi:hypothetical protein D2E26_0143 [Bifidobacterium dolichotidis]|uniref:Uncharacterized protein n=1 Tax=Bifidobacterium dolichotidis TaxID=2306976 RepID=A0A430FRU0_9BIFI|nr:hypothetical protein [Bifidobacterium dolichotidis]RSX55580.1 hypothetical protein D2E26_0143 [Bifidobacterium dolichotidis]
MITRKQWIKIIVACALLMVAQIVGVVLAAGVNELLTFQVITGIVFTTACIGTAAAAMVVSNNSPFVTSSRRKRRIRK